MWDDIKIGDGDPGNCACGVGGYDGSYSISSNPASYWITGGPLDIGMRVMRDTQDGKDIGQYLNGLSPTGLPLEGTDCWDGLDDCLTTMILRHITVATFKKKIEGLQYKAGCGGKEDIQREIKRILGLPDGY